jgi:hypothetical protein
LNLTRTPPDGELKHTEFLGISGEDPRRALAEQLCRDIPMNVCTLAYNKGFECGRIKEFAECFPDLAEHLLNIADNIKDLIVPFRAGHYYNRAMGGSFSIKGVLPSHPVRVQALRRCRQRKSFEQN